MIIENYSTRKLGHAAHLHSNQNQSHFVIASDLGTISIFDSQAKLLKTFQIANSISALSVHPFQEMIAVVANKSATLQVFNFQGTLLTDFSPKESIDLLDCLFDLRGERLLCISRQHPDEIVINSFSIQRDHGLRIIQQDDSAKIEDIFVDSQCFLSSHPSVNRLTLVLAAGQDGQQGYWVSTTSSMNVQPEPLFKDAATPVFSPDSTAFLLLNSKGRLTKYLYPSMQVFGSCKWDKTDDDSIANCYFLDNSRGIIKTDNGRLFLLNLNDMRIVEEVVIEGHEPKLVSAYFNVVSAANTQCTDIQSMTTAHKMIILVYRDRQCSERNQDIVIWLPESVFI